MDKEPEVEKPEVKVDIYKLYDSIETLKMFSQTKQCPSFLSNLISGCMDITEATLKGE